MTVQEEPTAWLRHALNGLKVAQQEHDEAVAALRRAEAAVQIAAAVLAEARRDVARATNAIKNEGAD